MASTTEPVFNGALGRALRKKHPRWKQAVGVEQTQVLQGLPGMQPDLILSPTRSSPVVLETEFMPAATVEGDAASRLGKHLASDNKEIENVFAVRIPSELRTVDQHKIDDVIQRSVFTYCVLTKTEVGSSKRWPERGWLQGNIDDLANCLESVNLSESLISKSTDVLESGVFQATNLLKSVDSEIHQHIAEYLRQTSGEQTNRMAVAIIANALMFHTRIEGQQGIPLISSLEGTTGLLKQRVTQCWQWIVENVNYWPIFKIASDLLISVPTVQANQVLNRLYETSNELAEIGATGLNDLSGRMFQKLITDRKFLATFYTLPVSATLLAELVALRVNINWQCPDAVKNLRVADLACGTGTLIGALYNAILARHRRMNCNDANVHSAMIEKSIYALDIMPAATHLAASTLSNSHPNIGFGNTMIVTMPYGYGDDDVAQIGSLELIDKENTEPVFSLGKLNHTGLAKTDDYKSTVLIPHGSLDIVIMNPPFTRPTGQEAAKIGIPVPSFAGFGTSESEQKAMSALLKRINAKLRSESLESLIAGHGNAGLASNFIDLAHKKIAPNGVLALVLPFTFVQGDAWSNARTLIETHYKEITVLSIATTGSTERAFSADTGIAEILIIASRRTGEEKDNSNSVLFVNLYRRPNSLLEAVTVAKRIHVLARTQNFGILQLCDDSSENELGSYITAPLTMGGCAGVRSVSTLGRAMTGLFEAGNLELPRSSEILKLPIVRLGEIGQRGAHILDITGTPPKHGAPPRGPFDKATLLETDPPPEFPALWNHDAARECQFIVEPDCKCLVRHGCRDHAIDLWDRISSRLHINVDFQLNSQPLAACKTLEKTIGGYAWPNFRLYESAWEVPFVLWANTTIGLLSFWWLGTRQQQGRARLPVSQHPLLPTLDPRSLTSKQLEQAKKIFEDFIGRLFLPANEAYRDKNRIELDHAVLIELLGLPLDIMEPIELLRNQWCAEPSVHGGKSTRP